MDDLIVALTYSKTPSLEASRSSPTDTTGPQQFTDDPFEWRRPQFRLLQPLQNSYEEVSKDVLGTNRYKDYLPMHYKLDCVTSGDRWYVLSPRDLVVARPREAVDSLDWMLQYHKYPAALHLLEKEGGTIGEQTEASVGKVYLKYLLESKAYSKAAELCRRVVGDDVSEWQELINVFQKANKLSLLYKHLPCSTPPPLPTHMYDTVLLELLDKDREGLVVAVQKWPSSCYDVNNLVSNVLQRVATQNWSVPLLQTLAHLYSHQQRHEKALAIYIKLQHKDIFTLIRKHNLYSCISHYALHLMTLDSDITIDLCMKYVNEIPPDDMMEALNGQPSLLYKYLSALYDKHKDLCGKYHDNLVELMADNQQSDKLLHFLKSSTKYNLSKALKVCKKHGFLHHTVYLLDRTGNTQDALSLVLLEARDIGWAIQLCRDHNDDHLWSTLIDNTVHYAENICTLLLEAGKYVGESKIIQKIPSGLKIPNLMDTINQIMKLTKKKHALHSGCEKLIQGDIVRLAIRRKGLATKAIAVDDEQKCPVCEQLIIFKSNGRGQTSDDAAGGRDVVGFKCQHVFHIKCLPKATEEQKAQALAEANKCKSFRKRQPVPAPEYICVVCQVKGKLFG